jgi:hypothetical protein
MDLIYVETTVIGNVAGRIHSNPDVASRQRATRVWWDSAAAQYELTISQLVIDECGDGDPAAAQERLDVLDTLTVLAITDDARACSMPRVPYRNPNRVTRCTLPLLRFNAYNTW